MQELVWAGTNMAAQYGGVMDMEPLGAEKEQASEWLSCSLARG